MDESYPENNTAKIILKFKINRTEFEVTRSLSDIKIDKVKITENGKSYFLEGEITTQEKYDRIDRDQRGKYLLKVYEDKIVECSNILNFDDLIFFVSMVLFFDEDHTT